jgi:hypothetical protein
MRAKRGKNCHFPDRFAKYGPIWAVYNIKYKDFLSKLVPESFRIYSLKKRKWEQNDRSDTPSTSRFCVGKGYSLVTTMASSTDLVML